MTWANESVAITYSDRRVYGHEGRVAVSLRVDLLEESFDLVVLRGDDLTEDFYGRVFARAPELWTLFAGVSMELQKLKFIGTLVVLRKSLRDLERVTLELEALGARHVDYGVLPEHYPIIGAALLDAMAAVGGSRWSAAYSAAWTGAYELVQSAMLRGAVSKGGRANGGRRTPAARPSASDGALDPGGRVAPTADTASAMHSMPAAQADAGRSNA